MQGGPLSKSVPPRMDPQLTISQFSGKYYQNFKPDINHLLQIKCQKIEFINFFGIIK